MSTIELKNEFHDLIDKITDKNILENFLFLIKSANQPNSNLIDRLSDSEKEELMLSDKESNNPDNLISNIEMKKKHSKWL